MQRRHWLQAILASGTAGLVGCAMPQKNSETPAAWAQELAAIEARTGGRLGVAVWDTATGRRLDYRGDETFALCSTFKLLLAAQVLQRAQLGQESLQRRVVYSKAVLVPYSPTTGPHADRHGLMVAELCEAAVVLSDNTAANLLLATQGGPRGLTQWLRGLGDPVTRLDRLEPSLNSAQPGDVRDTTSPLAMAATVQALLQGPHLDAPHGALLRQWLRASPTGAKRLRAGMPAAWQVGGKTGTGEQGTANDVVVAWPTGAAQPLVVVAYLTQAQSLAPAAREAALADVGRVVARWRGA